MRKKFLSVAGLLAFGTAVMFTSCSNDDDVINGGIETPVEEANQTLVLSVASSGDGLTTRAGRPLDSSEATQEIDHVKVIVCDNSGNVKFVKTIDNWSTTGSEAYGPGNPASDPLAGEGTGAHGRMTTIEIPKDLKLAADATYTVYAFGYEDQSDYDLTAITSKADTEDADDLTSAGTFSANTVLSFKSGATNTIGEEIFAGSASIKVEEGKGFKEPVVLNRQVAGAFGYVKDVPAMEGAKYLKLVASNRNEKLVLGGFNSFDLGYNGTTANGENIKYAINGESSATDKTIFTIDLEQWFTDADLDEDNNGIVDAGTNWKGEKTKYAEGSAFAGNFVIPFAKVTDNNTFVLQLTKEDGTELRSWTVKLPSGDGQLTEHDLSTWNSETSAFTASKATDGINCYDVVRNHLYGIGARPSSTPDKPGTDPDEPESLNTKQELTLKVNDNWEVIHQMDIE